MNNEFLNLSHQSLLSSSRVVLSKQTTTKRFSLDDNAISIMTNFDHIRPFLTTSTSTIDQINQKMIACGVRLLFVSDNDEDLLGLITYNDLFGEKPLLYIQEHGGNRDEITSGDIMTPLNQLQVLPLSSILKARIGDILTTFKSSGRQHLLVVDKHSDNTQLITGLFSSTQMEKQLGIQIDISPRANSFADVERALTG